MTLVLSTPSELSVQLLSEWLTLREIVMLDSALCAPRHRSSLNAIYKNVTTKCQYSSWEKHKFLGQLGWLINNGIRLSYLWISAERNVSFQQYSVQLQRVIAKSCATLETLEILYSVDILPSLLQWIGDHCTHFKKIELYDCRVGTALPPILLNCKHLAEIINPIRLYEGIKCPSVKSLRIQEKCTQEVQRAFLAMCPNLEIYDSSHVHADLSAVPMTIQELHLAFCELDTFCRFPQLKCLKLVHCESKENLVTQLVQMSPQLTKLYIQGLRTLSPLNIVQIADAYAGTLHTLSLFGSSGADAATLAYLCAKCSTLSSLDLGFCQDLADNASTSVLDHLPNLRALSMVFNKVTDTDLERIAASSLEALYLRRANGFTEEGVRSLIKGCKRLKRINFCSGAISKVMKYEWKTQRPNVRLYLVE